MSPSKCYINLDISQSQFTVTVMAVFQMLYTCNHPLLHQSRHYLSHLHFPLLHWIVPLYLHLHQPDEVRFKVYISAPLIMAMSAIQVLSLSAHVHITSNLQATRSPCIVSNHGQNFTIHPPMKALLVVRHISPPHM